MNVTYKQVKRLISLNFPERMVYSRAKTIRVGRGKARRSIPRRSGISDDKLLAVEMFGSDASIKKIKFMITAGDRKITSRNLTTVKAIIVDTYPTWTDGDWLTRNVLTLPDEGVAELGKIRVTKLYLEGLPVAFITIK